MKHKFLIVFYFLLCIEVVGLGLIPILPAITQGRTLSTFIPVGEIVIRTLFKNVPFAQLDVNFLLKVRELGFSQRQIKALDADFLNNIALFNAMKADNTLLQAWKVTASDVVRRKDLAKLAEIKTYITRFPDNISTFEYNEY